MSCLPCFAKKEEKKPPSTAGVDVPVHVEVVTMPPPVVEETIVMNDPVPALQISSEEPTEPTVVVEPTEEQVRLAAEAERLADERRLAEEQVRLAAEAERLAEERRLAEEQARMAAEAERLAEERRSAEEKRLAEAAEVERRRREEEEEQARMFAETQRLEEERRLAEEKRLAEAAEVERRRREEEEQARMFAETQRLEEERRLAEEKRLAEVAEVERRRREEEENRLAKERMEMPWMSSIQPDTNLDVKVTTEPPSVVQREIQPVEVALTASLEPQVDFVCPVELPPAPPAVSVRPLHQAFVPEDHETLLMIAKQSLRDLIEANNEVCINGPSYTALLHARCMVLDDVAELSVSLMQAARYPQVKVGPVRSDAGSKISVRAGLKYVDFGEIVVAPLVGDETARCVKHEGTPIMYFVRTGQLFTAVSPDGARMGKAVYMEDEELGPIMQILSEPNVDMLLTLVGLLTAFLGNSEVCDDILTSTSG